MVVDSVMGAAVVGASVVVSCIVVGCSMSLGIVNSISIVDSMVAGRVESGPSEASTGCVWVPSSGSSAAGSVSEYGLVVSESIGDVMKVGADVEADDADVADITNDDDDDDDETDEAVKGGVEDSGEEATEGEVVVKEEDEKADVEGTTLSEEDHVVVVSASVEEARPVDWVAADLGVVFFVVDVSCESMVEVASLWATGKVGSRVVSATGSSVGWAVGIVG